MSIRTRLEMPYYMAENGVRVPVYVIEHTHRDYDYMAENGVRVPVYVIEHTHRDYANFRQRTVIKTDIPLYHIPNRGDYVRAIYVLLPNETYQDFRIIVVGYISELGLDVAPWSMGCFLDRLTNTEPFEGVKNLRLAWLEMGF